jgi:DNA-binding CsgD family transcriptional regulator
MEPLWGRMATDIVAIESNLKATLQVYLRSQYPFLNAHGAVVVQLVKKYPVLNSNNIVCGIYSVGEIVTDEINLFELFKLYLKFYADKSRGIQNFLAHINLFNDFYELPTEREVIILIAKKYYYHPKLIASNLGIETKTVESHIYKIKLKLKSDLNSVVLSMRLRSGELI